MKSRRRPAVTGPAGARRSPAWPRTCPGAGSRSARSACLTNASGRCWSSAPEAARWSLRKASSRSRDSGEIRGLSSAASQADTRSSLRRRAITVSWARSTDRSSIGGLVSARVTAPPSVGSAERPQPGDGVADLGHAEERRATGRPRPGPHGLRSPHRRPVRPGSGRRPRPRSTPPALPSATTSSISRATPWASAWAVSDLQKRISQRLFCPPVSPGSASPGAPCRTPARLPDPRLRRRDPPPAPPRRPRSARCRDPRRFPASTVPHLAVPPRPDGPPRPGIRRKKDRSRRRQSRRGARAPRARPARTGLIRSASSTSRWG